MGKMIDNKTWAHLRRQVEARHPPVRESVMTRRQVESRALKEKAGWDFRELRFSVQGLVDCTPDERALLFNHWFGFVMAEYWIPRLRRAEAERVLVPIFSQGERANGHAVTRAMAKHFGEPVISRDVYLMHRPLPFWAID